MRYAQSLLFSVIVLFATGCGSTNQKQEEIYSGTVYPAGITSYQYGTHTLETASEMYALKSDSIDLTRYEQKRVQIIANKIEGYPVDNGPVYLNVISIKD